MFFFLVTVECKYSFYLTTRSQVTKSLALKLENFYPKDPLVTQISHSSILLRTSVGKTRRVILFSRKGTECGSYLLLVSIPSLT